MIVPLIIAAAAICSAGALAYKERDMICDYVEHKLMERRLKKRAAAVSVGTRETADDESVEHRQGPGAPQFPVLHSAVQPTEEPPAIDYTEEIEMSFRRRKTRGSSIGSDKTVGSGDSRQVLGASSRSTLGQNDNWSSREYHTPVSTPRGSDKTLEVTTAPAGAAAAQTPQYFSSSDSSQSTTHRSGPSRAIRPGFYPRRSQGPPSVMTAFSATSEQPSLSYSANSHGESSWGSSASDISSDYDFADERTSSEGEVVVVDPSMSSLYDYNRVQ